MLTPGSIYSVVDSVKYMLQMHQAVVTAIIILAIAAPFMILVRYASAEYNERRKAIRWWNW